MRVGASALLIVVAIVNLVTLIVYPESNARHVTQGLFAIGMLVWSCALLMTRKRSAEQNTL